MNDAQMLTEDDATFSYSLVGAGAQRAVERGLSEPLPEDKWDGTTGLIHDVLRREYLEQHADPAGIEYYLCGPPPMILAARQLLDKHGVPPSQVAYDEF